MDMKNDKTSKTKNLNRRIGIEVVIMKKLCKQEVIDENASFKLSGLNSVHLICNSYFNFWFNMLKR